MDAIIKQIVNNLNKLKKSCKKGVGKFYIKGDKIYTNKSHTEYAGTIKNNIVSLSTKRKSHTPKKRVIKNAFKPSNTKLQPNFNPTTNTFRKSNSTIAASNSGLSFPPAKTTVANASSPNASLSNASLPNASLSTASSPNASSPNASSPNASLSNASLSNASVSNASSPNASIPNASLPTESDSEEESES